MTENELLLDLQCYQFAFNPDCDINNLTMKELAEFITLQNEVNSYDINRFKPAPILELFNL